MAQIEDVCRPICGDGVRVDAAFTAVAFEACDVGPTPSRGCDAVSCQVRPGWRCERPAGGGLEARRFTFS